MLSSDCLRAGKVNWSNKLLQNSVLGALAGPWARGFILHWFVDPDIGDPGIGYDGNDDFVASRSSFLCFLLLCGILSPKVLPQPFPDKNLNLVTGGKAVLISTWMEGWSLTGPSWPTLNSPKNLSLHQPPCLQENGRSQENLLSFLRVAQNEFLHCNRKSLRNQKRWRELVDLLSSPKGRQLSSPHRHSRQSNIQQKMWPKMNPKTLTSIMVIRGR